MKPTSDIKELLQLPRHIRECPEVLDAIREIIEQDDEALAYYIRWMKFESMLRWTLQHTADSAQPVLSEIRKERIRSTWTWATIVVSTLLLALTAGYGIVQLRGSQLPKEVGTAEFVTESQSFDESEWDPTGSASHDAKKVIIRVGERINVDHGNLRLHLDSGVTLSCTAPVDLEVIDEKEVSLHKGTVYASVAPEGRGFRVRSPSTELIDLGTMFAMEVDGDGETQLQVLLGKVLLRSEKFQPKFLETGEACRVSRTGVFKKGLRTDLEDHHEHMMALVGMKSLAGNLELRVPPPRSTLPRTLITKGGGVIFQERISKKLTEPVRVYAASPGIYYDTKPPEEVVLSAGTAVSSYFIHTSSPGKSPAIAQIRFAEPILGIALNGEQLNATDAVFGHPDVGYPSQMKDDKTPTRGSLIGEINDKIEISEDRRTLTLQIGNSPTSFDQIRVFVKAQSARR